MHASKASVTACMLQAELAAGTMHHAATPHTLTYTLGPILMPACLQMPCSFLTLGSADADGLLAALAAGFLRPLGLSSSSLSAASSESPASSSCSSSLSRAAAAALRFCNNRLDKQLPTFQRLGACPALLAPQQLGNIHRKAAEGWTSRMMRQPLLVTSNT